MRCKKWKFNGGADRDRTDDLLNAIQALSQLSYSPIFLILQVIFSVHRTATCRFDRSPLVVPTN